MNFTSKLLVFSLVAISSLNAMAEACVTCGKAVPLGDDICARCTATRKGKAAPVLKELLKRMQGAHLGVPEKPCRIEDFCGYRIGRLLTVRDKPILGDQNVLVLEESLKKPFRFCTKATLYYSSDNGALYSVCLKSPPQRMSEAKAAAELEGIVGVLKEKYKGKQTFTKVSRGCYSGNSGFSFNSQTFDVRCVPVEVVAKGTLKGTSAKSETTYVFTVVLRDLNVEKARLVSTRETVSVTDGADVL